MSGAELRLPSWVGVSHGAVAVSPSRSPASASDGLQLPGGATTIVRSESGASAAIIANGLQGTYLHARGIAQKPGGWSNARYNVEMGPPLLAPLLVTVVGGMGLLAAVLRREQ